MCLRACLFLAHGKKRHLTHQGGETKPGTEQTDLGKCLLRAPNGGGSATAGIVTAILGAGFAALCGYLVYLLALVNSHVHVFFYGAMAVLIVAAAGGLLAVPRGLAMLAAALAPGTTDQLAWHERGIILLPARETRPRVIAWDQLAGVTVEFKTRHPAKPGGEEPAPLLTACTLRDASGLAVTVRTTAFISGSLLAGLVEQAAEELAPRIPTLVRALEDGGDVTFGTTSVRRDDISFILPGGTRVTLLWTDIVRVVNYGPGLQLRLLLKQSIVRQGDGWIRLSDLGDLGFLAHHAIARAGVPVSVERAIRRPFRPAGAVAARSGRLSAQLPNNPNQ
jgi:hypothetical protein